MGVEVTPGAVVRLHGASGVVGGGFLVGPGVVATCAHVVADAVGADPYSPAGPEGGVRLDFPLATGDPPTVHEAVVRCWAPIADDGTGDVALLQLTGPAPPEVHVPPLRRVDRLWDHGFRVLGFPGDRPDGVWSSGLIRGEQSTRWFQLQSTPGEQRIEGGFSGSPVWDGQTGAVVGMTVAADRGDTTTAYLIPIDQVLALDPALLPCPYRGLRPFDEEHAATFFGRDAEISRLLDAVTREPVVAVAGPSGAGKSSLVRAGLLPRLRAAGTPVLDVRAQPGTDLAGALDGRAPGSVVVIDQFEELAALDPDGARRMLEQVVRLTATEPVRVVLTARWAALDEIVPPELMGPLEQGSVLVAPMGRGRLREAIVRPAERSPGLEFEPGLVERILDDAGAEPGQLPLVASLLTDLWDRRDGARLTVAAYEAAGGVAGAVAAHAERAIARLGPEALEPLRRLLIALSRPDRDGRFVRRSVPLAHLPSPQRALLPALTGARLLVVGRPSGTAGSEGSDVVEPAHQALIDHWPRLRAWLAEDRAFLDWRDRVDDRQERWEAEDRADAALLRGTTLAEAADWLPARAADLTAAGADYVRRSQARQRWEVRRWRTVTAVLAVLGLVAATLSVIAVERRQTLASQLATANAGALARESRSRAPTDVSFGARLALAAWHADPEHPQARSALAAAATALQSAEAELANVSPATVSRLRVAGDTAIATGPPHPVALTGVAGPAPPRTDLPDIGLDHQITLSPDGRLLADVPPDFSALRLRDLTAPDQAPRTLPGTPGSSVGYPHIAPDGTRLMWLETDSANTLTMRVWDMRTNTEVAHRVGPLPTDTLSVWLTPDPDLVLVRTGNPDSASEEWRLALRSLADGSEVAVLPPGSEVVLGGAAVASCTTSDTEGFLMVTPVGSADAPVRITTAPPWCRNRISADGGFLVEPSPLGGGAAPELLLITDLRDGTAHEVVVPPGTLGDPPAEGFDRSSSVAVVRTAGGPAVLAAHHGSVLRLATRRAPPPPEVDGIPALRAVSDDGRYVLSQVGDTLVVEDAVTRERLRTLSGVAGEGTRGTFGDEIWIVRREPYGFTLTRYEIPTLRRLASFHLPASADPAPTSDEVLGGQDVTIATVETPQGRQLVSVSDGLLAVLDPRTGQPLAPPTVLGESPEERTWFQRAPMMQARPGHPGHAVVVGMEGELQLWDALRGVRLQTIPTTYRPLDSLPGPRAPRFVIDPTGARLALLTPDSTIEIWDLDTGELLGPPLPAPDATALAGVDADGKLLVVADTGSELRFVDLDERREAGTMTIAAAVDTFAVPTRDGSAVRVRGYEHFAPRLVEVTAERWREALCSMFDRPFTAAELPALPPGTDSGAPC